MRLSDKDKRLLYFLAMFLIIVAAFFLGYQRLTDKTLNLHNDYTRLNATYSDLQIKSGKMEKYVADTAKYEEDFNETVKKYAAGNTQEYLIMFLSRAEEQTGIWFSQTSFNDASEIYVLGNYESTNPSSTGFKLNIDLKGYETIINLTYEATYDQLKSFIKYVEDYSERYSIEAVSFSYEKESKKLNGSIQLKQYALIGNRTFVNADIPSVSTGTDNIFDSSSFTGNNTAIKDSDGASIINDYDIYMLLGSSKADVDSVILGLKNDDSSVISVNSNKTEEVTITLTGKEGKYRVSYKTGNEQYPLANYDIGREFKPGTTMDMLIVSSKRNDATDLSGAKVNIVNETDKDLNCKIINDDEYSPRYILAKKQDNIKTYE